MTLMTLKRVLPPQGKRCGTPHPTPPPPTLASLRFRLPHLPARLRWGFGSGQDEETRPRKGDGRGDKHDKETAEATLHDQQTGWRGRPRDEQPTKAPSMTSRRRLIVHQPCGARLVRLLVSTGPRGRGRIMAHHPLKQGQAHHRLNKARGPNVDGRPFAGQTSYHPLPANAAFVHGRPFRRRISRLLTRAPPPPPRRAAAGAAGPAEHGPLRRQEPPRRPGRRPPHTLAPPPTHTSHPSPHPP